MEIKVPTDKFDFMDSGDVINFTLHTDDQPADPGVGIFQAYSVWEGLEFNGTNSGKEITPEYLYMIEQELEKEFEDNAKLFMKNYAEAPTAEDMGFNPYEDEYNKFHSVIALVKKAEIPGITVASNIKVTIDSGLITVTIERNISESDLSIFRMGETPESIQAFTMLVEKVCYDIIEQVNMKIASVSLEGITLDAEDAITYHDIEHDISNILSDYIRERL